MPFVKKVFDFIIHPTRKNIMVILTVAILAIAIPLTVFVSQQRQDIRQRASMLTGEDGGGTPLDACSRIDPDTGANITCSDWGQVCCNGVCQDTQVACDLSAPSQACVETPDGCTDKKYGFRSNLCNANKDKALRWKCNESKDECIEDNRDCSAGQVCDDSSSSGHSCIASLVSPAPILRETPTPILALTPTVLPTQIVSPTPTVSSAVVSPTSTAQNSAGSNATVPIPSVASCDLKSKGDANCDGVINEDDRKIWETEFVSEQNGILTQKQSDFGGRNGVPDGNIDIIDFNIWQMNSV